MSTCPFCASILPENCANCANCGAALVSLQLEVGTLLHGKYRLERILGQGGFGITYLATDISLNRRVAIKELFPDGSFRQAEKVIPPQSQGSNFAETKQRFLEEARTLAQFNHTGIVKVFEVFEANNTAYIVMEALDGQTLGAIIARIGKLSEEYVRRIAQDVCAALEVVHQAGLLHRDIKPDNLYVTRDNRTVLIDFGSARGFQAGIALRHTQLVSPGYAAPEQYASQAKFGTYTDVYGLSATLYHALTGNQPPTASDRVISSSSQLQMPSTLSEPMQNALARGLALRIDERPQTVQEFLQLTNQVLLVQKPVLTTAKKPIPKKVQAPNFLFQNKTLAVTTTTIRVSPPRQIPTTIPIADVQNLEITNNGHKVVVNEYGGFVILVAMIASFGLVVYTQSAAAASACAILVVYLVILSALSDFKKSRKDIYYLLITRKPIIAYDNLEIPGKTSTILETRNELEARDLAREIHKLITP
jgi:serine/threonine protein kinase